MYDHSGYTIATRPFSCPWDSGQIGFVWITKATARKEMAWKMITKARLKRLEEIIEGEVKNYDDYLTGSVYTITVVDPEGNDVDSVGGWFGDDGCDEDGEGVREARSTIDHEIKHRVERALQECVCI